MNLKNLEFYSTPDGNVYVQSPDNGTRILRESDRELITELLTSISELYPKAYDSILNLYSKSSRNQIYYEFLAVRRFLRCNFGELDMLSTDIDGNGFFKFEEVKCPMRGECPIEGIVCKPELNTSLTEREKEILSLISEGMQAEKIASELSISIHTVNRHRENIKIKIKVRSVAEMIIWNNNHNIII